MIPEIIHDKANQKFTLELPVTVCDQLLLDHKDKSGLLICHHLKHELEKFRLVLIGAMQRSSNIGTKKQIILGAALMLGICLIVMFRVQIIAAFPSYKWPLYIGVAILGIYASYRILTNNLFPKSKSLNEQLALLEIHQRIKDEFSC